MVLTTPDGRIVEVNQAYLDMLGYSREELLTRDSSSFTYPDDVEPTVRFYRRFQSEGINTALIEKRYIRKNGEILWARASATMRREIDGRPTQLIAIIEDITERKRAEEAIRHSEARFRQLADSMPQIVATARPDGCFDYLNERWYQFTGYDRSSQGDESWKAILHPDDLRAVTDTWYECVHNGQSFGLEYRLWDRDENRWRWFIGRALPVCQPLDCHHFGHRSNRQSEVDCQSILYVHSYVRFNERLESGLRDLEAVRSRREIR